MKKMMKMMTALIAFLVTVASGCDSQVDKAWKATLKLASYASKEGYKALQAQGSGEFTDEEALAFTMCVEDIHDTLEEAGWPEVTQVWVDIFSRTVSVRKTDDAWLVDFGNIEGDLYYMLLIAADLIDPQRY